MADLQVSVWWEVYGHDGADGRLFWKRAEAEAYARAVRRQWDAEHPSATAPAVSLFRPNLLVRPVLCASAGHGMLFVLSREVREEP